MSKATRTRAAWPDVPELRREIMRANRRRDSGPERALRSALHRAGLRFRVDFPIRTSGRRPIRPDVVFPGRRVAVFVDGCFWHGCPQHGTQPATNEVYWTQKIGANRDRDLSTTAALKAAGWTVLRFWEHEDPGVAASVIAQVIRAQRRA
jgi:DNA mismatch endonuclease, patch repair protein